MDRRLGGMDASFLYMETPALHMHVCGVLVLDPSQLEEGFTVERLEALIRARSHLVPQFRWKLKGVPLNLDHPVWIDDPDFDLSRHISQSALPRPGTRRQLADLVGRIASHPLDRDRPLWHMWLIEGLEDGTMALVSKMHHAGIDGITGADLIAHLFDFEPRTDLPEAPSEPPEPAPPPSDLRLVAEAVGDRLRDPLRGVRSIRRVGAGVVGMARSLVPFGSAPSHAALPFSAPRAPWNGTLTGSRVVAFSQAPLDDLKLVKSTYGTTVNDVVLAACSVALRRYLHDLGELPEKPLLASVPVSVHGQAQGQGINQVSNLFVRIPTHLEHPVDMLRQIRAETTDAKALHNAMGADLIQDLAQVTPPGVFNLAARLYSSWGLPDRMPPVHNLIISNVPGPPTPLYIAGARVAGIFPLGPLIEGAGMNLTVLSNAGNMDFGVISCGDLVPDPWPIAEGWAEAVASLKASAERAPERVAGG